MSYVGIDLGTTNSAIASYDGESVRLYKSPGQHDVTPSALFFDRRGNKYVGARAYDNAARNPDSAATLFKRLMGTSTPVNLPAVDRTLTPEECSSEILKVLFGYLPEEIRRDGPRGTVITVPASFNQMQKEATKTAAEGAGIGRVALMQEPVAAVMSVLRYRNVDGVFLVYDIGGGTLDIAIAESIAGRISLLAHGGIAMCGGRDFDRRLLNAVVKPWLHDTFDLPDDLTSREEFRRLMRLAAWATEKAKIELSRMDSTVISLSEVEVGLRDQAGEEIYLDIPVDRQRFNDLIEQRLLETVEAARDTLEKTGMRPDDVDRIVFIGGPSNYKPLRDRVSFELGIAASSDLNPMTAVAEGAAVFAESVDWNSRDRGRKSNRGSITTSGPLPITLDFIARTPDDTAKVVLRCDRPIPDGIECQIDSLDTGWSSGRTPLKDGTSFDLTLLRPGENTFKVFVFDDSGAPIPLDQDRIVIARTAASVDAIPASHSIAVEARRKIGGRSTLDFLVREGDQLPQKGTKVFKAEESLRAGAPGSIRFKLWEGEIRDPITDNRFIGVFEIRGTDFPEGVIPAGADLICKYVVRDSGSIRMEVSVPSIGADFGERNFYSPGMDHDYSQATKLVGEQREQVERRIDNVRSKVDDQRLGEARSKLERAQAVQPGESDPEVTKEAMDQVQAAKQLLAAVRKDHRKSIRRMELARVIDFFDSDVRGHARSSEETAFDNLVRTAQRAIDHPGSDFEDHLDDLRGRIYTILWRQDWFVIDRFKWLSGAPHLFPDRRRHEELVSKGSTALDAGDMDAVRSVVIELDAARIATGGEDDILAAANIIRT